MGAWAITIVSALLIVAEGALLAACGDQWAWLAHASLGCAVALGMRNEFGSSALALTALLPLADWMAGGHSGHHALGLTVAFLTTHVAMRALDMRRRLLLWSLAVGALCALEVHALTWLSLTMGGDTTPSAHAVIVTAPGAALTAAPACAIVVLALDRLERALDPRRSGEDLLEM